MFLLQQCMTGSPQKQAPQTSCNISCIAVSPYEHQISLTSGTDSPHVSHQGLMLLHSSVLPFSHFPNKLQVDVPDTNVWGKSARGSRCSSRTSSLQVIPGFCNPLSRQIEATTPRLNRSTVLCFSSAITTTTVTPTTRTQLPCSSQHQPSPGCISIPCI